MGAEAASPSSVRKHPICGDLPRRDDVQCLPLEYSYRDLDDGLLVSVPLPMAPSAQFVDVDTSSSRLKVEVGVDGSYWALQLKFPDIELGECQVSAKFDKQQRVLRITIPL